MLNMRFSIRCESSCRDALKSRVRHSAVNAGDIGSAGLSLMIQLELNSNPCTASSFDNEAAYGAISGRTSYTGKSFADQVYNASDDGPWTSSLSRAFEYVFITAPWPWA